MYSRITMNLDGAKARKETLDGRDYLAIPTVMLTEGVHAGSEGPLLYLGDEIGKTPVVWNHKPVVLNHPTLNGEGISACSRDVLEQYQVGLIMEGQFDGRLRSESWVEADKLKRTPEGTAVLNAVQQGKMVEVSTGLYHDPEPKTGVWNGEKFIGIVRNIRPDHLAILTNEKGACSIEDGAGLLRNADSKDMSYADIREQLYKLVRLTSSSDYIYILDVFPKYVIVDKNNTAYRINYKVKDGKVSIGDTAWEEVRRWTTYVTANGGQIGITVPESTLSLLMLRPKFDVAARESFSGVVEENDWDIFKTELTENSAIFSKNDKHYRLPYTYADGKISFNGKFEEVQRVPEYQPVGNSSLEKTMSTPVKPVLANTIQQGTGQIVADSLAAAEQELVDALARVQTLRGTPSAPAAVPAPVPVLASSGLTNNAAAAPVVAPVLDIKSWLKNQPPEVQRLVGNSLAQEEAAKTRYIQVITNKNKAFNPEWLKMQDIGMLRGMAALASGNQAPQNPAQNFAGQGEAPPMFLNGQTMVDNATTDNAAFDEEILTLNGGGWGEAVG